MRRFESNWFTSLEVVCLDVRQAIRGVVGSPGFASVAVLTLALGIGAATALFSVGYGVLIRPLPYADAGRLVVIRAEQGALAAIGVGACGLTASFVPAICASRTDPLAALRAE